MDRARNEARTSVLLRLAIICASFLIMWHYAGVLSLWADDICTIHFVAEGESLKTIYERIMSDAMYNAPLFYILAFFWLRLVPYGTAYLKLLNILLCCLGMWFCGTAAKRLRGDRAAVLATVFAATSYYLVNYAAYTFRCYGLMFLLCTLLVLAYHRRLTEPNKVSAHVVYGLIMALMLYTNYMCGLVVAALGLYDAWLFFRKKIKLNCIFSYIGAGAVFLPLILSVWRVMIATHENYWPATPTLSSLMSAVRTIFSDSAVLPLLFFGVAVFLFCRAWDGLMDGETQQSRWTMRSMVITFLFVIGFNYVFSHYIHPSGSIFHVRYFICTLPAAIIVAAVGTDWLLEALCEGRPENAQRLIATVAIAGCLLGGVYSELGVLIKHPGSADMPYEQAIDWIHAQDNALEDDVLTTITIGNYGLYQGGLYYYGTHGGQREDLNFGFLTQDNWENYKTVYVAELLGRMPAEMKTLLGEKYEETGRNDDYKIVIYTQKAQTE